MQRASIVMSRPNPGRRQEGNAGILAFSIFLMSSTQIPATSASDWKVLPELLSVSQSNWGSERSGKTGKAYGEDEWETWLSSGPDFKQALGQIPTALQPDGTSEMVIAGDLMHSIAGAQHIQDLIDVDPIASAVFEALLNNGNDFGAIGEWFGAGTRPDDIDSLVTLLGGLEQQVLADHGLTRWAESFVSGTWDMTDPDRFAEKLRSGDLGNLQREVVTHRLNEGLNPSLRLTGLVLDTVDIAQRGLGSEQDRELSMRNFATISHRYAESTELGGTIDQASIRQLKTLSLLLARQLARSSSSGETAILSIDKVRTLVGPAEQSELKWEKTFELTPGRSSLSFSVKDSLEGDSASPRNAGQGEFGYGMTFNLGF